MGDGWSDAEITLVKDLYAKGHSAATIAGAIATDLGITRSRNAVIGIIHRKKVSAERTARAVPRPPEERSKPHGNTKAGGKVGRIQAAREKAKAPEVVVPADPVLRSTAWQPIAGTTPVPLLGLEPGMCKWPVGDAPTLFCGQRVERVTGADGKPGKDKSYCPYHERFAYGAGTPSQRNAVQDAVRAVRTEFRTTSVAAGGTR